jgi:hypothetical protein
MKQQMVDILSLLEHISQAQYLMAHVRSPIQGYGTYDFICGAKTKIWFSSTIWSDLENTMLALVGISFSEMCHKFLHSTMHSENTVQKSKEVFTCHVISFSDWTF